MEINFKKVHTGKDLCKSCRPSILDYLNGKDVIELHSPKADKLISQL